MPESKFNNFMASFQYPAISVIMPVYNTSAYLRQALASILGQTFSDLELIAVDDGSTDGSSDILHEVAAGDPRVTVISQSNRGQGAARNAALRNARGKYVYFMDSDDLLSAETFGKCVESCEAGDLDLVLFDADSFGSTDASSYIYDRKGRIDSERVWTGQELLREELEKRVFYVSPCLLFVRRTLLDGFAGFPEGTIHEDNVLAMHLMLKSRKVKYLPEKFFSRRVRPGSTMTSRFGRRNIDGYVRACTEIRSWKDGSSADSLIDLFLDCTLDSVIWLASPMRLSDKVHALRRFVSSGLFRNVSMRNWMRLFLVWR